MNTKDLHKLLRVPTKAREWTADWDPKRLSRSRRRKPSRNRSRKESSRNMILLGRAIADDLWETMQRQSFMDQILVEVLPAREVPVEG